MEKSYKIQQKISPWLGLEPTKMITLEQGIIPRKEPCYIELILDLPTVLKCSSQAEAG